MLVCPACGHENLDSAKFCQECAAALAPVSSQREQRKTVTVLFCDVTGSTALGESTDPEALRARLARYFERMKGIVESHGGTVEKFIGDAIMAVFGIPVVHEDDALRAVRAAVEMREALPELSVLARIGINTGEVVTGTAERLATGDAVNVAARLEQAASPGEILIGETTFALVRGSVESEALVPLELKGKAEPVPAHRIVALRDEPQLRLEPVFVGRGDELEVLRRSWQLAREELRCEVVTVVGDAGVGKSRLTAEFLASVDADVVRGRCPPYGKGITYLPVVEVLRQLEAKPSHPVAGGPLSSLASGAHEEQSAEEIAWAFRKLLEEQAPLVCVFDDIQWGEKTFLDLVEHLGLLSTGAPLLVLCMARPELAEGRPDWPVALRLEPLPDADVEALIPEELSSELRARISTTSGGNPLFVTEMVALARETGGDIAVPPTLRSLLAARLDQLGERERSVLERAAVEGEVFHRGAVQALSSEGQVTPQLAALVRKGLIRQDRAQLAGEDAFQFRHILIRDAAYDALSKAARAELHLRLARWLEERGQVPELDELLGYHLELAARYRTELGLPEDLELRDAARGRLHAAGQRAMRRQDHSAARSLFERAAALVPGSEIDLVLETEFVDVLFWNGTPGEALTHAEELIERATDVEDPLDALCAKLLAGWLRIFEPTGSDDLAALVERALPLIEAVDDPVTRYVGFLIHAEVEQEMGRNDAALAAFERAREEAARVGYEPPGFLGKLAFVRFSGSTPFAELVAWLDEIDAPKTDQFVRAYSGWSLAKLGRFDEARSIIAEARAQQKERGGGVLLANLTAFESVGVELLAGDVEAAVEFGEEGCRLHEELRSGPLLASARAMLAEAMYQSDRLDEAERLIDGAEEMGSIDAWNAAVVRLVRVKLMARRGSTIEAERLARELTEYFDATDVIERQGDAHLTLAEVLLLAGKTGDAAHALEQALDRFERKGNLVMARQISMQLRDPRFGRIPR